MLLALSLNLVLFQQYELQLGPREGPLVGLRVGSFVESLDGLLAGAVPGPSADTLVGESVSLQLDLQMVHQ